MSTGRIAVLVLVLVTLVVSAALPLRAFVGQRGQIAEVAAANEAARERVAALTAERARQGDPEHVAAEARRRLHFVRPGETAYVVIPPTPKTPAKRAERDAAWYAQLWDSVERADRPSS
jgi:cell division protein FtsB